jgi:hypothetical protein
MDDATLAKDLLLGKNKVQLVRITDSTRIKLYMRPTSHKRRDVKKDKTFLTELYKYLSSSIPSSNSKSNFYDLDVPGCEENDFLVLEICCTFKHEADQIEVRWNEYKGIAFV